MLHDSSYILTLVTYSLHLPSLYGITCFQTYNYYKGRFEDPWTLDAFVYALW